VFDLYLAGQSACDICDRVLAAAFHDIGDAWECGEIFVYRERRGCEIALKALHDLRLALRVPPLDAPVAIGGALEHDPYRLPTTMVEVALREAGWRAASLGTLLPAATLIEAVRENRPQLLWLSVSSIASVPEFVEEYAQLHETAAKLGTAVAVGGRALTEEIRQQMTYSAYCDTLRHLVTFVATLTRRGVERQ
jgi:methanogenic corrinoid protein MtbC1